MLGHGNDPSRTPRKTYLRSLSCSDHNLRSCPPPLSISRQNVGEWPTASSDDLPTPCVNTHFDFEFKRDKLAFFLNECSRIAPHLYLGSDAVARDRSVLSRNGITHVLNCVGFVCPEYFKGDLVYKTLWLRDIPSEDITSILYDVFDYFEDVREQDGRVLVHCCKGVSRSTSLVIAYLMWREGRDFEGAFRTVKAARGVTNPNMGFACQLIQCQKRVLGVPSDYAVRVYRMAPHSPYDPLHLVPKIIGRPGGLDSRGAFVVHAPNAIYVWVGKKCGRVMEDSANVAAFQIIRYERARGPILTVHEGDEPQEFWDFVSAERDLKEYDLDFEIYRQALFGGVVPPVSLSGNEETSLPARENGWGRLRRKLGCAKETVQTSHQNEMIHLQLPSIDEGFHPHKSMNKSWSFSSPNTSERMTIDDQKMEKEDRNQCMY